MNGRPAACTKPFQGRSTQAADLEVSMSACARGFVVCVLAGLSLAAVPAQADDAKPAPTLDTAWLGRLSRRAEQLSRVLLHALYAARDERKLQNADCFDRALTELHGLQRQVAFHGERLLAGKLEPNVRERHVRALTLASARLDYVAGSTARCGLDDVQVAHGRTRVETTFAR